MIKKCRECNLYWYLGDYYKHKEMLDGHLNKCKYCTKLRVKKYRVENIDKISCYEKTRANLPKRVKARAEYSKTKAGKAARLRANKKYRKNNPEKYKAHKTIAEYLRSGKIKKESCEICKSTITEAHHDDYSKPLEVRWLCSKHHRDLHRSL